MDRKSLKCSWWRVYAGPVFGLFSRPLDAGAWMWTRSAFLSLGRCRRGPINISYWLKAMVAEDELK